MHVTSCNEIELDISSSQSELVEVSEATHLCYAEKVVVISHVVSAVAVGQERGMI